MGHFRNELDGPPAGLLLEVSSRIVMQSVLRVVMTDRDPRRGTGTVTVHLVPGQEPVNALSTGS